MAECYFEKVKNFLSDLDIVIAEETPAESLCVIHDDSRGIHNMVIDCEDKLLVIEQVIFPVTADSPAMYKRLLQMNRELVHGAFVLDEEGKRVIFRDTLQLPNLDLNELDATLNALSLGLASFAGELVGFARGEAQGA